MHNGEFRLDVKFTLFSLYKISKKLLQNETKNSFGFGCSEEEEIKRIFT